MSEIDLSLAADETEVPWAVLDERGTRYCIVAARTAGTALQRATAHNWTVKTAATFGRQLTAKRVGVRA